MRTTQSQERTEWEKPTPGTLEELRTPAVSDAALDSNAQGLMGWLRLEQGNKDRR